MGDARSPASTEVISSPPTTTKPEYGKAMRKHFLFDDSWVNMNHGSFGAIPRDVRKCLHEKQELSEATPDAFIRFDYSQHLLESRRCVAELIHAPLKSTVLVPNATAGIDTILRNLQYSSRDHIVTFTTVYGTFERTTLHLSETTGVQVTRIPLVHPLPDADILSLFNNTVERIRAAGHNVKAAIIDTISFEPGVRMPFETLIQRCRELGILSCVDGAHHLGQLPINVSQLDPDFFVSNLHKWLYVPRGCAVLYVPLRNQSLLRTTFPTSWGFSPKRVKCFCQSRQCPQGQSAFETLFQNFGTMDYSPFLCVAEALKFRKTVCGDEEAIMRYNSELAWEGGQIMARILGTGILDTPEGTLTRGLSMVNVRLLVEITRLQYGLKDVIERIYSFLMTEYHTYVPVFEHGGSLWTRVSAQVYLDQDDFAFLGQAFKAICDRIREHAVFGDVREDLVG